jgi:hypothetical protein
MDGMKQEGAEPIDLRFPNPEAVEMCKDFCLFFLASSAVT